MALGSKKKEEVKAPAPEAPAKNKVPPTNEEWFASFEGEDVELKGVKFSVETVEGLRVTLVRKDYK